MLLPNARLVLVQNWLAPVKQFHVQMIARNQDMLIHIIVGIFPKTNFLEQLATRLRDCTRLYVFNTHFDIC